MLIGVAGRKGAGKSTVAGFLVSQHGFLHRAFADPIKDVVKDVFRLSSDQMEGDNKERVDMRFNLSPRQMMQIVGTDMFRTMISDDFWISHFKDWYNQLPCGMHVVVSDVRFQNELDALKELGGTIVKIERSKKGAGRHALSDSHISESDALESVDITFGNDGTQQDLYEVIENFIKR